MEEGDGLVEDWCLRLDVCVLCCVFGLFFISVLKGFVGVVVFVNVLVVCG